MNRTPKDYPEEFSDFGDRLVSPWTKAARDLVVETFRAYRRQRVLDLGCGGGELSALLLKAGIGVVVGIDGDPHRLQNAMDAGLDVVRADLNKPIPLRNSCFDGAVSQFSIEHLVEHDVFLSEVHRVLKPGSLFIITTDNLSSWHNIISLLLGYRPMSMHYSKRYMFGNPFSPHSGERTDSLYPHTRIFTPKVLCEFLEIYGFEVLNVTGIGYVPFPPRISKALAKADPTHSYFFTVVARKN